MATFSVYGMGTKGFQVDRPINEYERTHHFDLKKSASEKVHYDLSLIKLNSTFVECVDKWYSMRGFVAMVAIVFACVLAYGLFYGVGFLITEPEIDVVLVGIMLGFALGVLILLRVAFTDAFTYTHYPIRFNRQNRQVYAFRRDGTVLKAGWEDLYWTIYKATHAGGGDVNVMGHLLDKDGITVKESIGLSMVDVGEPGRQNMLRFFEFFRRYMEEGPGPVLEALKPTPLIMLPGIHKRKESWYFGWEYLAGGMKGLPMLQVIFQPFLFPISLFRWLVMRTSKIPQWPQWVEDECRVDLDDPWIRDERHAAK